MKDRKMAKPNRWWRVLIMCLILSKCATLYVWGLQAMSVGLGNAPR